MKLLDDGLGTLVLRVGNPPVSAGVRYDSAHTNRLTRSESYPMPAVEAGPVFPTCGEALADCVLVTELGRGVHSRVFLATQPLLAGRPVVLKVSPLEGHEHLTLARLLHTHLVPLHFVQDFPERNLRVLCQPYLGGATLAELMKELAPLPPARRTGADLLAALDRLSIVPPLCDGGLPARGDGTPGGPGRALLADLSYVDAVCWLGACLADALDHAHERGLVHLDVKPSNVLLAADGQPFLLDFHLARAPLPAGELSAEGFGGTPAYMAPEQFQAATALLAHRPCPEGIDGRADLYSLALILEELLGGSRAAGADAGSPLTQARSASEGTVPSLALWTCGGSPGGQTTDPLALRRRNPQVSVGLADVLARCRAADPERRYRRAADLAADLRRHLAREPLRGVPNRSWAERWRKWRQRRPQALVRAGTLLAAIAAVVGLAGVTGANLHQRQRQAETALADGLELYREGKYLEAEQTFARGLDQAASLPFHSAVASALVEERQRARTAELAGELHRVADQLRFLCEPQTLPRNQAHELARRCERLWRLGSGLLKQAGQQTEPGVAEQVRTDLLDVALLWTNLRIRHPGSRDKGFLRQALAVLDEAERVCGPSPVLERERRQLSWSLQPSGPDDLGLDSLAPAELRSPWERYALGRALLFRGDNDRALAALEYALREQPQGFWPNFYHGVCAYRLGRYAQAAAAFRVCVALAPRTAACHYNRALVLQALGQTDAALQAYEQALRYDGSVAPAWLNLGVLHYQRRDLDRAQAELRQALRYGADAGLVYYDLALVHQDRQDRPSAVSCLESSLRHRPDNPAARELLTRLRQAE